MRRGAGFLRAAAPPLLLLPGAAARAAAGDDPLPPGDGTVVEGEVGRALDAAVLDATKGEFWGAVLVARGGKVLLAKGYGFADYAKRRNTPRTLFEIASVSKSFTAAAILRLEMEKRLTLDDPLSRFFKRLPKEGGALTLRQLLHHTSGMSPESGIPYASPMGRDEMVRLHAAAPLGSRPGERFAYCNAAYAVLAAVVEVASGKPFEEYARARLFAPAGMADTGFVSEKRLDRKRDSVRRGDSMPDGTAADWHWGWGYRGMGGVVTTAEDLLRWDRALRGDGVLDGPARERWVEPALAGYALGWQVETTDRGTRKASHGGGVHGYGCMVARFLEEDAFVCVLSNGRSPLPAVMEGIEGILFPPTLLTLEVTLGTRTLDGNRALVLAGEKGGLVVTAGSEGISLDLVALPGPDVVATAALPGGVARRIAAELRALAAGRPGAEGRGAVPPGTEAGIYLRPYRPVEGRFTIPGLRVRLLPRYTGRGADGRPVEDPRIVLLLEDAASGQWPFMAKLDAGSAVAMAKALEEGKGE